jgi:hypothetical protein
MMTMNTWSVETLNELVDTELAAKKALQTATKRAKEAGLL